MYKAPELANEMEIPNKDSDRVRPCCSCGQTPGWDRARVRVRALVACVLLLVAAPASAQQTGALAALSDTLEAVSRRVGPAVVQIFVSGYVHFIMEIVTITFRPFFLEVSRGNSCLVQACTHYNFKINSITGWPKETHAGPNGITAFHLSFF